MVTQAHVAMSAPHTRQDTLLRRALIGNAMFSALTGAAMVVGTTAVSSFTGITPSWVPAIIGVGLLGWAVDVGMLARKENIQQSRVWMVIGGDLAWVVVSYAVLLSSALDLTTAGSWTIGIIAEIVGLFAIAQYVGLRKMRN